MMETIRFSFICKIIRKTEDSLTAILPNEDGYIVKFRDSKYSYFFDEGDTIEIIIENGIESKDEIKKNYAIIHVLLHSFISNGFLFRDANSKKGFFWSNRGMLTHKKFEKEDIFQENDILKIVLKKVVSD